MKTSKLSTKITLENHIAELFLSLLLYNIRGGIHLHLPAFSFAFDLAYPRISLSEYPLAIANILHVDDNCDETSASYSNNLSITLKKKSAKKTDKKLFHCCELIFYLTVDNMLHCYKCIKLMLPFGNKMLFYEFYLN